MLRLLAMLALTGATFACAEPNDAVAASPDSEPAPAVKAERLDVVDRAIALHGGDRVSDAEISLTISSKSGSFDVETRRDGESFEHRIIEVKDGVERVHRQTNSELTLTEDGENVEISEDESARRLSYVNQRMYFLFLPYKLNDPGVFKEDLGLETWDGRALQKVRVSFQPESSAGASSEYMYWFDPETSRLEQFAYDYSGGTGLRFRRLFNYREVGGVLFYDAENYGLNEKSGDLSVNLVTPEYAADELPLVSTITLSAIEVN
ncbi:MAG: DUF6503 family protein [Acidobacteriota bacterium]